MGNFVNKLDSAISIPSIEAPLNIHTEGNFDGWKASPYAPIDLVDGRFKDTLATAEAMRDKLIGTGGYLEELENIISEISVPDVTYSGVSIGSDVGVAVDSPPGFTGDLETDFGTFDTPSPAIKPIPDVDMTALLDGDMPEDITTAISWFEEAYDNSLYTPLFNRLITDLQSGASGIGGTVEQEIYDRAQARQNIEEDKQQTEIEEYFSATGFDLPTGAMAARLQEHANGRAMRSNDLNSQIMIEQAELAQKNSQFVIEAARGLESVLRDYASKKNDRSLDYQKAVAANAIAIYAEQVRGYLATLEANRDYVQLQVENLKAVVEANKGAVAAYAAEAEAFMISVTAKTKKNEAITDVYKAEIEGYDSETKAISENQKNVIQAYALKIQNADNELKAAIANAENAVSGYGTEYSLRERVAESMANVAMQSMASAYGAVNSSAGISYNGSESQSESWSHSEARSDSYSHSESISNSASIGTGVSNTLSEQHSFLE